MSLLTTPLSQDGREQAKLDHPRLVCGFRREAGRHSDQYPATVPI
ncbi:MULTISPECIES: hypothetical protein [Sinorhizobium]|nr:MULTISPECIES: hypothetical protein [Sinorhizobium]WOS66905.1 hypothetical protein SFGR64A_31315 [Sinorhizobium fredii GR64]